jgi:curved DNA-binding protein
MASTDDPMDYYEVLGVERTAGDTEIKRAYRKLAQQHHPDINTDPGAEERFKRVGEAYDVLSNPELRKKYDAFGADFRRVPDDVDPEEWAAGQRMREGAGQPPPGWQSDVDEGAFQDFLQDLLREQGRARQGWGPIPGADQRASISLSLDDAFHGGRRSLTMGGPTGARSIEVNIPAGVTDGQTIRLPGKGGRGTEGAPAGDLYLHVTIEPDPRYRVSGRDIEVDLPLAPWEAALGATVPVEGPGGTTRVKVAAGTSSDKRLRIRGKGIPTKGKEGDLYARVRIVVPDAPSSEEQDLYSRLAEISDFQPRSNR